MLDRNLARIVGWCVGIAGVGVLLTAATWTQVPGAPSAPGDDPQRRAERAPSEDVSLTGRQPRGATPLVGIAMHLDEDSVNDLIQRVLRNVERVLSEGGHRAVLGIVTGVDEAEGVHVTAVTPDGPAHQAGLRSGDIILSVDGVALAAPGDVAPVEVLLDFLQAAEPGDPVSVHYLRNGHDRYTDVLLGDLADLPPGEPSGRPRGTMWEDLELVSLTPSLGKYFGTEEGLLVLRAPADLNLDLRDGDVVLAIGGRAPRSPEHARRILESYQKGEELMLQIKREMRLQRLQWVVGTPAQSAPEARVPSRDSVGMPAARAPFDALDGGCVLRRL
jgi:hypothetical protein